MTLSEQVFSRLRHARAVWVSVDATQGSVPRDAHTWMAVFADTVVGTIGGGRVEFDALREARQRLGEAGEPLVAMPDPLDSAGGRVAGAGRPPPVLRYALGPSLGQCCGGVMHLRFELVGAADIPALKARIDGTRVPVALFGGGHVGRALIEVLARLPFAVTWIDSRDEIFPEDVAPNVACEHSEPVHGAVAGLAPGTRVLVMSFSHAEDLDVVAACLTRQRAAADLPYIGLIGSTTKWATFRHRLQERGFSETELSQVTSPIGVPGVVGKEPEVIAVAVAAQLLQRRNG